MIVQACLNGTRTKAFHPQVPITLNEVIKDARACVRSGAAEIHVHPRNRQGDECLAAVPLWLPALRQALPGTLIGVSTGQWITGSAIKTHEIIAAWQHRPDHASVNLCEDKAADIMNLLHARGIGIEAGLAKPEDAERLIALAGAEKALRILIEVEAESRDQALALAEDMISLILEADLSLPILIHSFESTAWDFVHLAGLRGFSTRIGFEDVKTLPSGQIAANNAELVSAAHVMMQQAKAC